MRSIDIIGFAVAAATLAPGAAFAQDAAPFTGPYVGAVIGADRLQGGGDHDDGFLYGGAVGWDWGFGQLRAGVEAEVTGSTQEECEAGDATGDRVCLEAGRDLYIGGRIGTLVGSSTMLYAKAGYSNARLSVDYDAASGIGSFRDGEDLDGVRLGAGIEHMLTRNIGLKAEYRYSNYENDVERHQIVGGLTVRF